MRKIYLAVIFNSFFFLVGITSFAQLSTTFTINPPGCLWGNNGTVTFSSSGGIPPYTYDLNGISTTDSVFTGLMASNGYVFMVTDSIYNQFFGMFDIPDGDSIRTTTISFPNSCPGVNDGMVAFTMSMDSLHIG